MDQSLQRLPEFESISRSIMEMIITNIILIGQIPAPTFKEMSRCKVFMDRLSGFQVDECTTDGYRNPIGIIHGKSPKTAPIFVVAHIDTAFGQDVDHNFTVEQDTISGAGVMDNAVGLGVMASLPEILRRLNLTFNSDIVLAGTIQSLGQGNLRGIRHLLETWHSPIRAAVCIEGGELGRLNYYSDAMIRSEIQCRISKNGKRTRQYTPNAIIVINEVINQILKLYLPQRPRTEIVLGTISGGLKHGHNAYEANLGFEIRSDSDAMVHKLYTDIKDIVEGIAHEFDIELNLKNISNVGASRLKYNHPLVKNARQIIHALNIEPASEPTETELSIFLSCNIPALTVGITYGESYQDKRSIAHIDPIFKGIAQIIGILMAIDSGVCDEQQLD
jgi:acetylornithine deacetylase/succinyl-diaminopimelate desuccinylase-like protein